MTDNNNKNSLILLLVLVLISMIGGILLPSIGIVFSPYLLVWLGILLFLNLIKLELTDLLSGISTGLGAPFVVNFVGGEVGRKRLYLVVGMILVTSLLVPFTLPSLVY